MPDNTLSFGLTYGGIAFFDDCPPVLRGKAIRGLSLGHRMVEQGPKSHHNAYNKHQAEEDMLEEVNKHLPPMYLSDFMAPRRPGGKFLSAIAGKDNGKPNPEIRVGDWYYPPTASRWSVFRGLATSKAVTAMLAATEQGSQPAEFVMLSNPILGNTGAADPDAYTNTTQMFMLPPRPLGETAGTTDGLYLITLVDERYYLQGTPVSLSPTIYTQWGDLLAELATAANIDLNIPTVPSAYGQPEPDSQLWSRMESVAYLLDAVAYNLGMVVVRNMDGTYDLLSPADSYARLTANRGAVTQVTRLMGGNLFEGSSQLPVGDLTYARNPALPATVNVAFPSYVYGDDPVPHFVNQRYRPQRPSCKMEDSFVHPYVVTFALADCGLTASPFFLPADLTGVSQVTLRSTAKALFETEADLGSDPTNGPEITNLAAQIAADYVAQQAFALDEVYPGTAAWEPEGFHDLIWTYSPKHKGARLRVMRGAWNDAPTEFQHGTPPVPGTDNLQTTAPPGVGGPSVAQTWRDTYSGSISTTLARTLNSGDTAAYLNKVDYLPTQNRWKAAVAGQSGTEILLLEGTSGGVKDGSDFRVDIAQRPIDGTATNDQDNGSPVTMLTPNVTYGVNLVTAEKGQFSFPAAITSGGIAEVTNPPPLQTVRVLAGSGVTINGVLCYSGQVNLFDPTASGSIAAGSGPYERLENVWVTERNGQALSSGEYLGGQLAGFSKGTADATSPGGGGAAVATAPVYLCDLGGGGGGGGPQPVQRTGLSSGSNTLDASAGAGRGFLWVLLSSATDNPTTIDNITGGVDGLVIEVTNATGLDIELRDAALTGGNILCPTNLDGAPSFTLLHDRETVWVKYDANAAKWRLFERLPRVITDVTPPGSSTTIELARSRIKFIPCCKMGVWVSDDPNTDTAIVTIGTTGLTTTQQIRMADGTTRTNHYVCGLLVQVDPS